MDKNLGSKSREFSLKVIKLHKQLTHIKKETVMSEELIRCGAGAGAELSITKFAMGKNDHLAKVYKALQNCAEAKYWLDLLYETDYITEFEFNDTSKSCDELIQMIIAFIKHLKGGINA